MEYGYARVSTINQHLDRQIKCLIEKGLQKNQIYTDKESGKDFNRPAYKKLIRKLKKGDVLFIKSIDRLGRNYKMIIEEWVLLTKIKLVDIVVIDMPLLDTRRQDNDLFKSFISDIVLQILSFVAENERAMIKQRQEEGIQLAKIRGVKFGRPKIKTPENFNIIINQYKNKEIDSISAIKMTGLSRGTFYRKMNELI